MANTIQQGYLGQNIEQQGATTFNQGLGIPSGGGNTAPLFPDSGVQIRYNTDDKVIQYWESGNAEWKTLADTDEVNSGSVIVEDYATMMIIVNSAIASSSKKPLSFLVLNDEETNKEQTVYLFFPNEPSSDSVLKYIPSSEDISSSLDFIDPKSFGVVGDGITDDTTHLIDAITAASNLKKPLVFYSGTYLTDPIDLPNDCFFIGKGKPVFKLKDSTSNDRQIFKIGNNTSNIYFQGLVLDANRAGNSGSNIVCVFIGETGTGNPISNISFTDCTFGYSKDRALLWLRGFELSNVTINNCTLANAGAQAIEVRGTTNLNFHQNIVTAWGQVSPSVPGMGLQSVINDTIFITDNKFKNTVGTQFSIESAGAYVQNANISGNVFDGNNLSAGGCSGYFRRTIFSNNTHVNGVGSHRTGYEMIGNHIQVKNNFIENGAIVFTCDDINPVTELRPNGDTFICTGNIVKTNAINQSSLYISGFRDPNPPNAFAIAKNVIIQNNSFDNRGSTGNSATISLGFYGTNGYISGVQFSNNHVYADAGQPCIRMRSVATNDNVRILNNNFFAGLQGIRIDDPSLWAKVEIRGNDFRGCTSSEYVFGTGAFTSEFKVQNNVYTSNYQSLKISSDRFILSGSGTPEGSITAPVGSFYLRVDGSAGTTAYIKESGTGNTGWSAIASNSGVATLSGNQTFTGNNTFNNTLNLEADGTGAIWNPSRGGALNATALTSHSINATTNNIFIEATRPGAPGTSGFRGWIDQSNNQLFLRSGNTDWHLLVADNEVFRIFNTHAVHIQDGLAIPTFTDDSSVIFAVNSTTKGFRLPKMTSTERTAIAVSAGRSGIMVYDTTLNKVCFYNGTAWEQITSTVIP